MLSSPAAAQCAPDPTVPNGNTACAGTDSDGLIVTTDNTQVSVLLDGIVRPGGAAAAIITEARDATLRVAGLIDGSAKIGILVTSGISVIAPCDPYAGASVGTCIPGTPVSYPRFGNADILVASGGTITGGSAIVFRRASPDAGSVSGSLRNAGTITGTGGEAILFEQDNYSGVTIVNDQSGTITGGIAGTINYVTNAGRIDGVNRSAIATTRSGMNVRNSGAILSSGATATLSSLGYLGVINAAGGTIGGSTTAIITTGALALTNNGTIEGSVISTASAAEQSDIDTRAGTIVGDLRLGAGDDTLRARFDASSGRISSITGTIDGGSGTDTVTISIDGDAVLERTVLPTNFELLGLDLTNNPTVTIAPTFTPGNGVALSGFGTVVNRANLVTQGPAIRNFAFGFGGTTVVNQGTITATFDGAGPSGLTAVAANSLRNAGTITAVNGGGASVSALENSGTITATGTGVSFDSFNSRLTNSGTIRSTAGTAVRGGFYSASTNTGEIVGATTGLLFEGGDFTNSGTITGGVSAIAKVGYVQVTVRNAGIINGSVNLFSPFDFGFSDDVFIDDDGIVNGAIRLGGGNDQLVVTLGADPARPLAGATGGVDPGAGYDVLRYRVIADADVPIAPGGGFEGLAYELSNDAALTLTAASPIVTTIGLAGSGTVTLDGTISTTDRTLIDATILPVTQSTGDRASDLTVINNGTLTLTATSGNYSYRLAAIEAGTGDVTNNGTITVANAPGVFYPASAITDGRNVLNAGTIALMGGGIAIASRGSVVNTGTITASDAASVGVSDFASFTNTGLVRTGGTAVQGTYGFGSANLITNSGTIESLSGSAIALGYYGTLVNETGGTIRGSTAAVSGDGSGNTVTNRGSILGDVQLGSIYSFGRSIFLAEGGLVAGSIRFGSGADLYLQRGDGASVTGVIDGGNGIDIFGRFYDAASTIGLGGPIGQNFEQELVEARGTGTVLTLIGDSGDGARDLYLGGDGRFVNRANRTGETWLGAYYGTYPITDLAGFTNEAAIGTVRGAVAVFDNRGTITATQIGEYDGSNDSAVNLNGVASGRLQFANSGTITGTNNQSGYGAVSIYREGAAFHDVALDNTGTIAGGIAAEIGATPDFEASLSLINTGTITATADNAGAVFLGANVSGSSNDPMDPMAAGVVSLVNSGRIEITGSGGSAVSILALDPIFGDETSPIRVSIVNSGTILAASGNVVDGFRAFGLAIVTRPTATTTISNLTGGVIAVGDTLSTAVSVSGGAFVLDNAGSITGRAGGSVTEPPGGMGSYAAGAIRGTEGDDRIVNTGTITGSIALGGGGDRIENFGRLDGDVFLGASDDTFLQRASGFLSGTVDGGLGSDSLTVDATGGGTVNGDQFVNFEFFSQVGDGNVTYSGTFRLDTIGLSGGTITVAEGETLGSTGEITIRGSEMSETLDNRGTILGTVVLGGGADTYVDHTGSSVAAVDGGTGSDLYRVILAGDRGGIAPNTGFERLTVEGAGTLTLALDQSFDDLALVGAGANLTLGDFTVGRVTGSDLAETLTVDGNLAEIDLGGGNDVLALGATRITGRYTGSAGSDILRFTAAGPVTLAGSASGFEQVELAGGSLVVTGTLGSIGTTLAFGNGAQHVAIVAGGILAGAVDLGADDDSLRLAAGSVLSGNVAGGGGTDSATIELAGDRTLANGTLADFERLATEGSGTLTLTGAHSYQQIAAGTDLKLASDAAVTATQIQFGPRDDRFTIDGSFSGSVDGGAGNDTIAVSSGSSAVPIALGTVSSMERYVQTGGFVTVAGVAGFDVADLSAGYLVGGVRSTIGARQITVAPGATFGSAGTVIGNLTVAGTLSPGASVGTMKVNGNVSLAPGSLSLFEIEPTGADRLLIDGTLTITSGATLQLASGTGIRPGLSYDLIVANGGITGSYSKVLKPDSLFGFVVQRMDRIQLLGQFLGGAGLAPQIARSIDYANATLQVQPTTSNLFASLPALLATDGSSNPRAFAQLTPEAYASATQAGIDNALTLAGAARGPAFTTARMDAGLFTFGQLVGQWHSLGSDTVEGTSAARTRGYGFLGGFGYGTAEFSVGAFGGHLDSRQTIAALGTETKNDGFVGGVNARYASNRLGLTASLLYDGGQASTARALPDATRATGRYDLHSWVADVSVSYAINMDAEWSLRPRAGITYLRTTRDSVNETGGPFALEVAHNRHTAGFVDGGMMISRSNASTALFQPFVALGVRYQVEGRRTDALSGYAGGPLALAAYGVKRARAAATASAGVSYRVKSGLELFTTASAQTGRDDYQESIATGVSLRF